MNPIHSTFHNAGMTGDMAFLYSEFLGVRLCKSSERLKHFACQIAPQKEITSRQIGRKWWPSNFAINVIIFWRNSV
jgi:hypothetical protein